MDEKKLEDAYRTIRESGAQRPFVDPPPSAKWKAYLLPGTVVTIVLALVSFGSSYAGKLVAEGQSQQQTKDMAREITGLQEQVKWNRENLLSNKQFDEYVRGRTEADRTLNGILTDIRNHQK